MISNPLVIYLLYPIATFIQYNTSMLKMPDGKLLHEESRCFFSTKTMGGRWTPTASEVIQFTLWEWPWLFGEAWSSAQGMVCLPSCSESGYLNQYGSPYAVQRDADIKTYLFAVKTIVELAGGHPDGWPDNETAAFHVPCDRLCSQWDSKRLDDIFLLCRMPLFSGNNIWFITLSFL